MGSLITKLLGAPWNATTAAVRVLPTDLDLTDFSCIVAGGTSGIGLEVAKALCSKGAYVAILGSSMEKGQAALQQIKSTAQSPSLAKTDFFQVDVTSLKDIQQFAAAWKNLGHPLHALISIAGTFLTPYRVTEDGFEQTTASNYIGNFYLAHLLLDDLKTAAPSRFIWMSSAYEQLGKVPWGGLGGEFARDSDMGAYTDANLMCLMAAREMGERLSYEYETRKAAGRTSSSSSLLPKVDVFSVQPGLVNTPLYDKMDVSKPLGLAHIVLARLFGQDPAWGAGSAVYAAAAPELDGKGWAFLGPPYFLPFFASIAPHTAQLTPRNPHARNKAECAKLYDSTVQLLEEKLKGVLPNKLPPAAPVGAGLGEATTTKTVGKMTMTYGGEGGIRENLGKEGPAIAEQHGAHRDRYGTEETVLGKTTIAATGAGTAGIAPVQRGNDTDLGKAAPAIAENQAKHRDTYATERTMLGTETTTKGTAAASGGMDRANENVKKVREALEGAGVHVVAHAHRGTATHQSQSPR